MALDNVVIVLDKPKDVVNVAGVVRVMMNMGLSRLRLVDMYGNESSSVALSVIFRESSSNWRTRRQTWRPPDFLSTTQPGSGTAARTSWCRRRWPSYIPRGWHRR